MHCYLMDDETGEEITPNEGFLIVLDGWPRIPCVGELIDVDGEGTMRKVLCVKWGVSSRAKPQAFVYLGWA